MLSGIANAFSIWRDRHFRTPAQTPASMTLPGRQVSDRELSTVTFPLANSFSRRFIALTWRSLAAAEKKFAEELPPIEALRAWLLLFIDYIAKKQLIAPALSALAGDPKKLFEASYARIWEAVRALVKRAIKTGDIRGDLDPTDLLRALIGVATVATSPDWRQSARRLVDILIAGARPVR